MRTNWFTVLTGGALLGIAFLYMGISMKAERERVLPPIPPAKYVAVRWYRIGDLARPATVRLRSTENTGFYVKLGSKRKFIPGTSRVALPRGPILVSEPHVVVSGGLDAGVK
ncbi:MAG: hypothetical protein ACP5QA_13070 [Phycisphaerae bacterium]